MANVILNGVNKKYPSGTLALYGATFTANDSELLVLCGGEASGKSTLLRVIAGLEEVTEGEIKIANKAVTDVEVKDRNVAMLFRNNTLNTQQTVYENLAFGLAKRNAPKILIDKRVKAVASVFGLTEVLSRKVKTVTTEQKQLITLGRALVREPDAYLFDDPFSGLEEDLKAQMIATVASLRARVGGAFIYATPSVLEAMSIADRIVVLKDGFVQQIDTPANLYDYPVNEFVAFFIGSPTINFIRNATVVREEDNLFVCFNGVKINLPKSVEARLANGYENSDKKVTVGIRPEDLSVCEGGEIKAEISSVSEGFIECDFAGNSIIVATQSNKKGEEVAIKVDAERLYLFDAETTLSILSRDENYQNTGYAEAEIIPVTPAEAENIKNKAKPAPESKKNKK
ncbi:MAG: ABC transporter ATP-binding protein [Clostridiales bacterium]|nr:ABC transporter ATP-binding protein [Clostridiales bacterium]